MKKRDWLYTVIILPVLVLSCSYHTKQISVYHDERPYLLLKDEKPKRVPPVPAFDIALLKIQGKDIPKIDIDEDEEKFLLYEEKKTGIKIPPRKDIKKYLIYYASKNKRFTQKALQRSVYFMPMIKKIFSKYNLPEELAYLPVIESGFDPFATSRTGAAGIWQFVPTTAKRFGLKITSKVDERRDPYKSTIAAAKYLKYLYNFLKRWDLAIAAYNCGEGCVKEKLSFLSKNFWDIKYKLPKQTREYVPRFYAIALIVRNPEKYGIYISGKGYKIKRKLVKRSAHLKDLSKIYSVDYSTMKMLNAHFIRDIAYRGYHINFPIGSYRVVKKVSVRFYKYRVKRGDSLYTISKKTGVPVEKIKSINGLIGDRIFEGQILKIPLEELSKR